MTLKKTLIMIVIFTLMISTAACTTSEEAVVAKINDRNITYAEFNQYYSIYAGAIEGADVDVQEMKEKILDEIVQIEAIKEYVDQNNIEIDNGEIEKEYTDYMDYLNSNEEAKKYLTDNNISEDFVKELITNEYYAAKFYDAVTADMEETEEAVEAYYEDHKEQFIRDEVKASHILVDTKEEAEDILEKINAGDDFAELAKEYSKDTTAENGGDLGFFPRGMMVQPFNDAAFALEVGEVSDIVETQFGFHIIKVTDKINDVQPLEEVREYVLSMMYDEYYNEKLNEVMANMDIEKYPKKLG